MATNIGTAFFNVTFNTAAARREVTAMVSHMNRNLGLIGGAAVVAATAAIAGLVRATAQIGTAALQASIDYEQAFASVRKTVDDGTMSVAESTRVFGQLNEELRGLALEVPLDLEDEIANVAALGGQLGIAADDLTEFTRIIGEVGVTTNVSVEDAATSFARLANVMGLSSADFRDLGDTVVNLGNKLPAQEDEILRFANRIAAAGEIAGFSADEVLAVGAAMASVGVPSERGGTAIQRTWIKITDAVANGGEVLDLIAQVSGETSEQFAQHWEEDAAGAWVAFVEGLGRTGTDAFGILRDLGLNDQRVIQSLLSIANAGDLMRQTFGFAANDLNALGIESEIFFNTTEGQLHLLQNLVHDAGITIGDEMKPAFRDIIASVTEWIQQNPELIQQLGQGLANALERIGDIVDQMAPVVENLIAIMPTLVNEFLNWVEPVVKLADNLSDVAAGVADFYAEIDRAAAQETGVAAVGATGLDLLTQGVVEFTVGFYDATTAAMDQLAASKSQFRFIGDEVAEIIRDARFEASEAFQGGAGSMDSLIAGFVHLRDTLEETAPDNAQITKEMFDAMIEGAGLTAEEIIMVGEELAALGIFVPFVLPSVNVTGDRRGRGGIKPPHLTEAELLARQIARQRARQFDEEFESPEDLAAAEALEKTRVDTFTALTAAAEKYGVSIDVVLDNFRKLAPEAAAAMYSQEEGLGEATIRADMYRASLENLRNVLVFKPATEGIFGVGDVVNGIDVLTRTIEGKGDALDKKVRIRGQEYFDLLKTNLDQIARFEMNLAILFLQGQETLAQHLLEQGPAVGQIAADMVSNWDLAEETERLLDQGGSPPDALIAKYDEALGSAPPPQGFIDFVSQLGSDAVIRSAYNAGNASGQQYGSGWARGFMNQIPMYILRLLGMSGAAPGAGRTPSSGILDRTPAGQTDIQPGTPGVPVYVTQNFNTEPTPTPQTQMAMQQAASVLGIMR